MEQKQTPPKNKPTIVLFSGQAEHGKNFAELYMRKTAEKEHIDFITIAFADYLKALLVTIYGWNGEKDEAGRALLQKVGEEFRRIDQDFWARVVENTIQILNPTLVFIPDLRYPNEIEYFENRGYKTHSIQIIRPNHKNTLTEEQKRHISEIALLDYEFNWRLINTGDSHFDNKLQETIEEILGGLK